MVKELIKLIWDQGNLTEEYTGKRVLGSAIGEPRIQNFHFLQAVPILLAHHAPEGANSYVQGEPFIMGTGSDRMVHTPIQYYKVEQI